MTRLSPPTPGPETAEAAPAVRAGVDRMIDLTRKRWKLGREVDRLMKKAKAARRRSGDPPPSLRKLAPEINLDLDVDLALARASLHIFQAFPTKESLEELLARRRKDGKPLACSTLALLCRPGLEARRQALLDRVFEENMGEIQLKALLGPEADPGRNRPDFGCRPKSPTSLSLGLERWKREARRTARYTRAVFDEASIAELVRQARDSDVAVDAVAGVEKAIMGAIEAMVRQAAAVGRIKSAVIARDAGPGLTSD